MFRITLSKHKDFLENFEALYPFYTKNSFPMFCFLGHAEQFYNHLTTASSQRWSNLSKWIFGEFIEKAIYSVAICFDVLLIIDPEEAMSLVVQQFSEILILLVTSYSSSFSGYLREFILVVWCGR